MNYGLAYSADRGWDLAAGRIRRAASIRDRALRLVEPVFGRVPGEPHRGMVDPPKTRFDAFDIVAADQVKRALKPLIEERRASDLVVETVQQGKREAAVARFLDERKQPVELSVFVGVY